MNALAVLHDLIDSHDLYDAVFTLVSHPAGAGWRERVGPPPPLPAGTPIPGRTLRGLSLEGLRERRDADADVVSLSSRLEGRHGNRHLALMDVQVPEEVVPFPFLEDVVHGYCGGRPARILWSGRGYHVYGDFLLAERDWERWNNQFLTGTALAPPYYVVQSLAWRCNLLRLTAGSNRQTPEPVTVETEPIGPIAARARRLAHARHGYQVGAGGELVVRHLDDVASVARRIAAELRDRRSDVDADEVHACGYLHACLEDTATYYEDVVAVAGPRVAEWVAELSRDKRRHGADGRESYEQQLAGASLPARIVKLADLLSELGGAARANGEGWTLRRLLSVDRQLDRIQDDLDGCPQLAEARGLVADWRDRI